MVIGYYQRERNGNIYVDLGKTEGILPKKYQSPREVYHPSDRVRALIYEVAKSPTGLQIVLSRTHAEFVRKVFELEVPELYDHTIEIYKIVREPGYRTKMAVYSNREDVDPVGACVGLKGVRIQAVVRELEGEKIDVLKYDPDPRTFIRNALLPAEVEQVVVLDEAKKSALAVVQENNFSLAIGKQGLNVRLANRLVDWNIDVRRRSSSLEMDLSAKTSAPCRPCSGIWSDRGDQPHQRAARVERAAGDISRPTARVHREPDLHEREGHRRLSGVSRTTPRPFKACARTSRWWRRARPRRRREASEAEAPKAGPPAEVAAEGAPPAAPLVLPETGSPPAAGTAAPKKARFAPEPAPEPAPEQSAPKTQGAAAPAAEETYECPECGAAIRPDMTACPNCGVGLSFEEDEGQDG
jgi:N utilization substance protein A